MMQPKRTKYRKRFKGRNEGLTKRGAELNFGAFGMKATDNARVSARQIEAARRAITRHLKRAGRGVDPRLPGRAGQQEARRGAYGQGQGLGEYWVVPVKAGRSCSRSTASRRLWPRRRSARRRQAALRTRFVGRPGEPA